MRNTRSALLNGFAMYLKRLDKAIIILAIALCACGMVAITSAVLADSSKARCIPMQLIGIAGGFIIMFIVARIDYEFICDLGKRIPRVYVRDGMIAEQVDYFA